MHAQVLALNGLHSVKCLRLEAGVYPPCCCVESCTVHPGWFTYTSLYSPRARTPPLPVSRDAGVSRRRRRISALPGGKKALGSNPPRRKAPPLYRRDPQPLAVSASHTAGGCPADSFCSSWIQGSLPRKIVAAVGAKPRREERALKRVCAFHAFMLAPPETARIRVSVSLGALFFCALPQVGGELRQRRLAGCLFPDRCAVVCRLKRGDHFGSELCLCGRRSLKQRRPMSIFLRPKTRGKNLFLSLYPFSRFFGRARVFCSCRKTQSFPRGKLPLF